MEHRLKGHGLSLPDEKWNPRLIEQNTEISQHLRRELEDAFYESRAVLATAQPLESSLLTYKCILGLKGEPQGWEEVLVRELLRN